MSRSSSFVSLVAVVVAIAATAIATNPDEKSFKKYIESKLKSDGRSWLERKAAAHIASMLYDRQDFKLFSVIDVPEENTRFIGLFSLWLPLPLDWSQLRDASDD
ncbi:hypothetical protein BCR44DRAFT_1505527 [Catenaria anguillulae PL171]|uniref:Uncharacterized protein n=1 Tax=Catenaria anguillulae PL171 TaxID=765915 RepID=A0A1Y2H6J1_9FUNG|nr:hypothetical protein BCR44DRAFT_1505527 [Catenaria anguillulae PL171]